MDDYADKLDESGQVKLPQLLNLTNRMKNLISVLLSYSRLGQEDITIKKTDLNTLINNSEGTGSGLAFVKIIVELHYGEIWL